MKSLPPIVLRAPQLFYGAAVLFFVCSFALTLVEIESTMEFAPPGNPMVRASMLRGLFQAALEAVYLAANGVLAHILLAIWQNGLPGVDRGGDA